MFKIEISLWLEKYFLCSSMVRIQQKIAVGIDVLKFFTMKPWQFCNDELKKVRKSLTDNEFEMFPMDTSVVKDRDSFVKSNLYGGRVYCLKDPLSTLPRARLVYKMWVSHTKINVTKRNKNSPNINKNKTNVFSSFHPNSQYVVDRICKLLVFYWLIRKVLVFMEIMWRNKPSSSNSCFLLNFITPMEWVTLKVFKGWTIYL